MIPHVDDSKNYPDDYEVKAKEIPWQHRLLLDRHSKVLFVLLVTAIAAPMLIYHLVFFPSIDRPPADGFSVGSCVLPRTARLPCGANVTESSECHPQCCFDHDNHFCFHRFPSRFSYILAESWSENVTLQPRIQIVPFNSQPSFRELKLSVDEITPTHMSLTFYNSEQTMQGRRIEEKYYSYHISQPELNIIVNDSLGNEVFNTIRGPLIASENIWEISFRLTEDFMYGLGEIPLLQDTRKILYNHDAGTYGIPLIFSRTNNTFHGFLIDVIEPTELRVLGENQMIVRSITKNGLKFHLFTGPTPKDIMMDVKKYLGFENKLKYWMLGAHICSDNKSSEIERSREETLRSFIQEATEERLPYESHCGIGPIVFNNNQCDGNQLEKDVGMAASLLRNANRKFIPRVAPYIHYTEPNITTENNSTEVTEPTENFQEFEEEHEDACFDVIPEFENMMLKQNGTLYKGLVGNDSVIYPDYEGEKAIRLLLKLWTSHDMDGLMLADSWPLDESQKTHNETFRRLPYFNENFQNAFNHTPQWNISRPNGNVYLYNHNQYGTNFANAFRNISQEDIPIWASSQRFNGDIVYKQHVNTTWLNLQKELIEVALGGVSGHWLWASPVCGDTEFYDNVTNVELCVKWYMAATYLPLVNIYSKTVRKDPLSFGGVDKQIIMGALNHRLQLLPYFYTTLQEGPLLRPMFYQFPSSQALANLRSQFSVGEYLMIVPNLQPGQTHVHVVKPPGTWYELWSGFPLEGEEGDTVTMTTTQADFLTLLKAGSIIVMQKNTQQTAEETRLRSDYSLTIALHCVIRNGTDGNNSTETATEENTEITDTFHATENTSECKASGSLYMTENMTIIFKANDTTLNIKATGDNYDIFCQFETVLWARFVTELNIFGLNDEFNNYDHHRQVRASIDFCQLENQEEISFNFLP